MWRAARESSPGSFSEKDPATEQRTRCNPFVCKRGAVLACARTGELGARCRLGAPQHPRVLTRCTCYLCNGGLLAVSLVSMEESSGPSFTPLPSRARLWASGRGRARQAVHRGLGGLGDGPSRWARAGAGSGAGVGRGWRPEREAQMQRGDPCEEVAWGQSPRRRGHDSHGDGRGSFTWGALARAVKVHTGGRASMQECGPARTVRAQGG